jgi:hypothetical protein
MMFHRLARAHICTCRGLSTLDEVYHLLIHTDPKTFHGIATTIHTAQCTNQDHLTGRQNEVQLFGFLLDAVVGIGTNDHHVALQSHNVVMAVTEEDERGISRVTLACTITIITGHRTTKPDNTRNGQKSCNISPHPLPISTFEDA